MAIKHFNFEHKSKPLLSISDFYSRQLIFIGYALGLLTFSLGIGIVGYRVLTGMAWIDAFYNASMILTGMGPIDDMPTAGAKLFAGSYALFSGIIFLSTVAVMFSPLIHRFLHIMHLNEDKGDF
jgi:hypothetical protein